MTRSLLAAVLAATMLAACGGGNGGATGTRASAETSGTVSGDGFPVTIEAFDLYFEPKELTVPAGTLDITYVNQGSIYHNLKIGGANGGLVLDVNRKGEQDQGSVTLSPGEYTFYCDVPGHQLAGMETRVIVE